MKKSRGEFLSHRLFQFNFADGMGVQLRCAGSLLFVLQLRPGHGSGTRACDFKPGTHVLTKMDSIRASVLRCPRGRNPSSSAAIGAAIG